MKLAPFKLATTLVSLFFLVGQSFAEIYVIKKGDTLSDILKRKRPNQLIYGSHGTLKKTFHLNPHLKSPSLIFPGQEIHLMEPNSAVSETESVPTLTVRPDANEDHHLIETNAKDVNVAQQVSGILITPKITLSNTTITSKDSNENTAKLVSPKTLGVQVEVIHIHSKVLEAGISIEHTRLSFEKDPDGSITKDEAQLTSYSALARYNVDLTDWTLHVGSWERLYLKSSTIGVVDFEKLSIPGVGLDYSRWFHSGDRARLGCNLESRLLLASSKGALKTKNNMGLGLNILSEYKFKSSNTFRLDFSYDWEQQNINWADQYSSQFGIGASYSILF